MSGDIVRDYLERAVYDLRFEKKQELEKLKRANEAMNWNEEIVIKSRARLVEMEYERHEIEAAATTLGIVLEVRDEN